MNLFGFRLSLSSSLDTARWLMLAILIALLFSPPLTNFLEVLLVVIFLSSPILRYRLRKTIQQPLVVTALFFWVIVSIGTLYSIAPPKESFLMLVGWRKLLLLPLAASIFDETRWKCRLVWAFWFITTVCAVLATVSWVANFSIYKYPSGIIIRNYATQGIMFAVAAFTIAVQLRFFPPARRWQRIILFLCLSGLLTNLVYLTPGRSGYLAFLILAIVFIMTAVPTRIRYGLASLVVIGIALMLFTSPTAYHRLSLGFQQIQNYDTATGYSAMGIRVVFWKNTIQLIKERPWFGYGTGSFEEAYRQVVAHDSGWRSQITGDPHNQFLKIIVEHGFIGFLFFLAFLGSAVRTRPSPVFYILAIGILWTWCGTSFFSSHFSTFSEGTFVFLWLGAMLAPATQPEEGTANGNV